MINRKTITTFMNKKENQSNTLIKYGPIKLLLRIQITNYYYYEQSFLYS